MKFHKKAIPLTIAFTLLLTLSSIKAFCSPKLKRLTIEGDTSVNGIYDPSIEYAPDGSGWMAYSSIEVPKYVHTRISKSSNRGKTWTFVNEINQSTDAQIEVNGETLTGVWRHETPSLVHHPEDTGKEWKLYWHKYFILAPFEDSSRSKRCMSSLECVV